MKKLFNLLPFLAIIIFSTCGFEFSEDYYKDIVTSKPNVSLSLTNFIDGETIRQSKGIKFNYQASNKNRLYEINFFIDDQLVESFTNSNDTFLLDISNLSDTNHILKVEYFFKTSSGSLAEISGSESYKVIEEFNFSVDKSILKLEIDRVEHTNGTIYIYFKPYSLTSFIDESISAKLLVSNNRTLYREIILTKESIENGVYNDVNALSLDFNYRTKIKNDFQSIESDIKKVKVTNTFKIYATLSNEGFLKINWTDYPLYNNITKMSIRLNGFNSNVTQYNLDYNNKEKIIPYKTVVFGKNYSYSVQMGNDNNNFSYGEIISSSDDFHLGQKFETDNYKKIAYNKPNNQIYALEIDSNNNVYINKLNINTLSSENKIFITRSSNSNGDFTFNDNNNIIIDLNSKSILVDKNSFNIIEEYNINDFDISTTNLNNIVRFRKNTFVIENLSNFSFVKIFDIPTRKRLKYEQNLKNFNISMNGQFMVIQDKIYKKTGIELQKIYEDPYYRNLHSDFAIAKNKIFFARGYTVGELDLLTLNEKSYKDFANIKNICYIDILDKILIYGRFLPLVLYDYKTGQKIEKKIEILDNKYLYIAEKNYLISPYGFLIKDFF
ncbi:hypothetical protein [Polaribacter aquimarinus]|uniref:Uncharacterized protein n=1 Tax=Polaribacter aquimarinus TaxID=2100726 RepID=A0A2U2J6W4_9FLAO|nr:hypothetical protein [Polaribacter aquimarinus]PWG04076.1 hypothetical protein DIS07_13985 [Polaribacter aquimarinus]